MGKVTEGLGRGLGPQTPRLRELLDGAGVSWRAPASGRDADRSTIFDVGMVTWAAEESDRDGMYLYVVGHETEGHLTAERAIALTLGPGRDAVRGG